jgi:cytoskeletal protein CcmA (bactofilin family)
MFTRKPEMNGLSRSGTVPAGRTGAQAIPSPAVDANSISAASVIGADVIITGDLECKGALLIEGEVQGDIHARRVLIGKEARITGGLIAEEVIVGGSVQGSIRGKAVTFQSSGRVEGDVFHVSLVIEQGAFFEGKSRRSEDPLSVQRTGGDAPPTPA